MNGQCRCCGGSIENEPLIVYDNLPQQAQFFPEKSDLLDEKGIKLAVYQCPFCGLIQLLGEPVSYHRDVIRATGVSEDMGKFRKEQYEKFLRKYQLQGKKILEIGAGKGEYMQFMKAAGGEVYGYEHRKESAQAAQENGLTIYEGYLENSDMQIPGAPYHAFYMMNFLEHIPKPGELLKGIYNNLTDDAVGIVEVPNVDMILKKELFSEFILDHLMYFTKDTFKRMLELNGFEVLEMKDIWYEYIISATVRKRTSISLCGFDVKRGTIEKSVKNYISSMQKKRKQVAAWGAGHQALADFSLLHFQDEINMVIDSAQFKQNHYTPATHIPVMAPAVLDKGEIGAVLIMAAGYSDEISKIINEKWPDISIAVLRDYGVEVIKD